MVAKTNRELFKWEVINVRNSSKQTFKSSLTCIILRDVRYDAAAVITAAAAAAAVVAAVRMDVRL